MEKKRFVAVVLVCSVLAGACMAQKVENLSESLPYEAFYNPADAESPAGKILPKMRMSGDTLFVAMSTGLYAKDVEKDGAFSLYAFPDMPVLDFVRSGNRLMVLSMKRSSQTDSLLLVSEDRGATFRDGTPRIEGLLSVNGMAQNPLDPESLLIVTDKGLYKSPDFGETWTKLSDTVLDYPVLRFHPADTALVFMAGSSTQTQKGLVFRLDLENGESSVYETEGEGRFMDLLFDSGNPEQMWITGSDAEKIYRSQDGGKTWQGMNTAAMEYAQVPCFTCAYGVRSMPEKTGTACFMNVSSMGRSSCIRPTSCSMGKTFSFISIRVSSGWISSRLYRQRISGGCKRIPFSGCCKIPPILLAVRR